MMAETILDARRALLLLAETLTKHNAAIRARFPVSHPIYKIFERSLFGFVNDLPWPLQVFISSAEDAACRCEDLDIDPLDVFTEGVASLVDAAQVWVDKMGLTARGKPKKKSISVVERALLHEAANCARVFFDAVYRIPKITTCSLAYAEEDFWVRHTRAQSASLRARTDPDATFRIILCLQRRLPDLASRQIVSFLIGR